MGNLVVAIKLAIVIKDEEIHNFSVKKKFVVIILFLFNIKV
jgi:hypothetical protein